MIWIILGGALGSMARFGIYLAQIKFWASTWPATLSVNMLGCFGLGICYSMYTAGHLTETGRFFWMIGFWASFTTFSTFAMDMFTMVERQQTKILLGYILASIVLGLIFFTLGCKTHKAFI
ncbi:MAG: CrcB family protein [Bdellovibrionota bacterium]